MTVSAMAIEVLLSKAVPNTVASQSSLTANPNPLNTPPATGLIAPPQAPTGSITNQAPTFNFNNTITSTREYLDNIINVEGVQQGSNVISNVTSITVSFGGIPAAQLAVFKFS